MHSYGLDQAVSLAACHFHRCFLARRQLGPSVFTLCLTRPHLPCHPLCALRLITGIWDKLDRVHKRGILIDTSKFFHHKFDGAIWKDRVVAGVGTEFEGDFRIVGLDDTVVDGVADSLLRGWILKGDNTTIFEGKVGNNEGRNGGQRCWTESRYVGEQCIYLYSVWSL